jgi:hypothetical protein
MKRIILLVLVAGVASTVQAQNQPVPASDIENAVRISAPLNTIELPGKPRHLFRGDFDSYRGTYDLSNGGELMLTQRGKRIYATLGGGQERELVAAAHNVFVAKDRNLKITLVQEINHQMSGEVLIRHPRKVADMSIGAEGRIERLAVR